jgi:hypothetical protein
MANDLINRAKNLKQFVVLREFDEIPPGVVKFDIQHKQGELAQIFVHALTQDEAERLVDDWMIGEDV